MLKLRRIRIEGFKALDAIDVEVSDDVFFLIGTNGAGKSSILQAIAFVRAFAEAESSSFFEARHWSSRDVYPKTTRRESADIATVSTSLRNFRRRLAPRPVRVSVLLENSEFQLFWEFAWLSTSERTLSEQLWIRSENG